MSGRLNFACLCALLGILGASQQATAADVVWNVVGPAEFNVAGNWLPNTNVPSYLNDDIAIITNGGTAFVATVPDGPAALVLGRDAATTGTLEVRNLGVLNVNQFTTGNGSITVGSAGRGTLRVLPGGTLNTVLSTVGGTNGALVSGNNAANTIVLGAAAGAGTANVSITGVTTLGGTTQVFKNTAWTVNNTAINLGATSVYAPVIDGPAAANLAKLDSGTATTTLGGTLKPTFSVTPSIGSTWDVLHAANFAGAFASVQGTGLGPGQRLKSSIVGTTGDFNVQITVEQVLSLQINRNTRGVTLANPGVTALAFDVYAIQSAAGQLVPAKWTSLDDQNVLGGDWLESTGSNANHLSEVKPAGTATMNGATSVNMGEIYKPNTSPPFGTPNGDDITLTYAKTDGTLISGEVTYTGITGINNFVLQVDPVTGKAQMKNTSSYNIAIDSYSITSEKNALTSGTWTSFDDQNIGDWLENASSNAGKLSEVKPTTSTMMVGGISTVQLGAIFNTTGERDLVFQFLQPGQATPMTGVVIYESFGNADFDSDGDVDGQDFLRLQRNLGATGASATLANGNANGDTVINAADLQILREQFGNVRPAAAVGAASAVPEPSACALLCVAVVLTGGARRRRGDRFTIRS
jgi:hypothetical protein